MLSCKSDMLMIYGPSGYIRRRFVEVPCEVVMLGVNTITLPLHQKNAAEVMCHNQSDCLRVARARGP